MIWRFGLIVLREMDRRSTANAWDGGASTMRWIGRLAGLILLAIAVSNPALSAGAENTHPFLDLDLRAMLAHLKGTAIKTSFGGAGADHFDRGEAALRATDRESARLEAIEWHGRAAKLGYAPSQYRLALLYAEDDSSSAAGRDALAWAKRAADQDLPEAVFLKGLFVYHGVGQGHNRTVGVALMLDAADRGYGEAQYVSGRRLLAADGMERDVPKGLAYLESAHQQGVREATHLLARLYEAGLFVEKDPSRARSLAEPLARADDPVAQILLGRLIALQGAASANLTQALTWFYLAQGSNLDFSRTKGRPEVRAFPDTLRGIESILSAEQRQDAQRRAEEWRKRTTKER